MKSLILLPAITLIILSLSCKKNSTSNTNSNYSPTCSGTKSYSVDVKPIIQASCVGCHSEYGNYTGVSNDVSKIRTSISNGSMPKNSTLSSSQKDAIMCWIDAGATNN